METISYTSSTQLRDSLKKIEELRQDIYLTILTPLEELGLRFEALVGRIFWALSFSDTLPDKKEIAGLLLPQRSKKRLTPQQQEAVRFKKGLDYIIQEWQGSQKPVSLKTVLFLHQMACPGRLRASQESLRQYLSYFQDSNEHPVIQAALIHYQILELSPFTDGNDKLARLLTYLFLYKEGFDCRGFLVLDEYSRRNLTDYQQIFEQTTKTGNQTAWLEYFAKAVASVLEKTLQNITSDKTRMEMPATTFKLNDRQKEILAMLENPAATITNRQVQKLFKVSQITASRDLAKLVSLGLAFTHGRGRSVYYTRV